MHCAVAMQKGGSQWVRTMRIWLYSDWHLEHYKVPERDVTAAGIPDADLCIVPGDMHRGDLAVEFLGELSQHIPVVYVAGNHDFYGNSMPDIRSRMAIEAARFPDLYVLDPGVALFGDVRVIGATLWTDYGLQGEQARARAMAEASASLNDHRVILSTSAADRPSAVWSVVDARRRHLEELAFIEARLAEPFVGVTIVVSHHGPHPESVHERFRKPGFELLNAAFVSDLTRTITTFAPALWVHGHIHDSVDYRIASTRVIANPRGYQIRGGPENPVFDPRLVVEV